MLKKIEMNFTMNENKMRMVEALGALVAVLVLVGVSAVLLNNVVATPISPREACNSRLGE